MLSENVDRSLSHLAPHSEDQLQRIGSLRGAAKILGAAIEEHTKPGRERALAITNLEQSLMWAVKAVVLELKSTAG